MCKESCCDIWSNLNGPPQMLLIFIWATSSLCYVQLYYTINVLTSQICMHNLKPNWSLVSKSSTLSIPDQKRIALVFSPWGSTKTCLNVHQNFNFWPQNVRVCLRNHYGPNIGPCGPFDAMSVAKPIGRWCFVGFAIREYQKFPISSKVWFVWPKNGHLFPKLTNVARYLQ